MITKCKTVELIGNSRVRLNGTRCWKCVMPCGHDIVVHSSFAPADAVCYRCPSNDWWQPDLFFPVRPRPEIYRKIVPSMPAVQT